MMLGRRSSLAAQRTGSGGDRHRTRAYASFRRRGGQSWNPVKPERDSINYWLVYQTASLIGPNVTKQAVVVFREADEGHMTRPVSDLRREARHRKIIEETDQMEVDGDRLLARDSMECIMQGVCVRDLQGTVCHQYRCQQSTR